MALLALLSSSPASKVVIGQHPLSGWAHFLGSSRSATSSRIQFRIVKPQWPILAPKVSRTDNMIGIVCQGDADSLIRDAQHPTLEVVPVVAVICRGPDDSFVDAQCS